MEDNTRYIMQKVWKRMFFPAFIGDVVVFIVFNLGLFFLIARYCKAGDLVVYSAFLPFALLFMTIDCFFAIGAPQLFAIYKGAGRNGDAQKVFAETLTTYGILAGAGFLLILWQMPKIVAFLEIPKELTSFAIQYGRLTFLAWFMDSLANLLRGFLTNDSLSKQTATIAISNASLYFLFCVFILGVWHCSVLMLPISMVAVESTSISCYLFLVLKKKATIRLQLKTMNLEIFKGISALSFGNIIVWATCFVGGTFFVRWSLLCFGNAGVTLVALCSIAEGACTAFEKSFITSAQSIIGMFRGEKNIDGIRLTCKYSFIRGLITEIVLASLIALFAAKITQIMPVQENFSGEAVWALRCCMLGIAFRYAFHFICGYYNVCGHLWLVSISSLIANSGGYFMLGYVFFFILGNEWGFWFFYLVAQFFHMVVMLLAGYWQMRRKHLSDILLLPTQERKIPTYYFLVHPDPTAFQDYREMLALFLKKQKISAQLCHRARLLFEELFLFAEGNGTKKDPFFCVETRLLSPSNIVISLRYNSAESCLNSVLFGKQENLAPSQLAGAKILTNLSDEIYIDRIYGFNYVRLTLLAK